MDDTIQVDINTLINKDLTPNQYIYLKLLFRYDKDTLLKLFYLENEKKVKDDLYKLYQKGYIKLNIEEEDKSISIETICELIESIDNDIITFIESIKTDKEKEFDSFLEKWYELFPKGIATSGYPVRSGITGCKKKMLKFIKKNKNISYEEILKATENYIAHHRKQGFQCMQTAHYFIEKNGVSTLESMIEKCKTGNNTPTITYGNTRG